MKNRLRFIFLPGQIVCSQPRRLAARQLASRVAQELGYRVGDEVRQASFIRDAILYAFRSAVTSVLPAQNSHIVLL